MREYVVLEFDVVSREQFNRNWYATRQPTLADSYLMQLVHRAQRLVKLAIFRIRRRTK